MQTVCKVNVFAFNGNRPIAIKQKPIWLWAGSPSQNEEHNNECGNS